ncbi:DEAD/DEAH box helicase [Faecalibaculum rodentium]|jgi:superfamily II DNA or RNA helicase|uniref:DEAD/DEAH box helicase n=1 Tax=Faecalibaculum rodentium TaxID=1702221 RepID=UPI0025AFC8C6|nr:DEAD/DEAH box helicase [Faecalibaculum rodentium]
MQYKLRPYQSEACRSIMAEFEQGTKRTLLILPTGGGKTIVLSGIAYKFAYDRNRNPTGGKVLILAHQNILIDQAADKFQTVMELPVFREQGRQTGCMHPVTVSSMQTMQRRLDRFPPDFFQLIIIDEAHHAMSAGYQKILKHFTSARVLGVTATPDRADKKKLSCFDSIAFEYTIGEAIRDGYLVPLTVKKTPLTINLSKVRKRNGDMDASDLGSVIEPYLHQIAEIVRSMGKGRRIVCFLPLIRTAKKAAEVFSHYGFRSQWTAGEDDDKTEKLAAFAAGEYDIIFNSMLLTEGWDCPETDCVIVLRPTMSRALYVQMVGRGLRLAPGKKDCLLIDFLFQNDNFQLASPKDVLGENRKHSGGGGMAPWMTGGQATDAEERLAKALDKAAKKYQDPRDSDKWRPVLESLETTELFDPPCTDTQKRKLKAMKLDSTGLTYGQADAILKAAEAEKMPSNAMRWRLSQLGYSDEEIAGMNFPAARKALAKCKAMGRW